MKLKKQIYTKIRINLLFFLNIILGCNMKKSNKTTIFYIISCISLFILLIGGGCYGIYMSVGLSFVRNGVSNITEGVARNVSFGATANFSYSMIGVITLSIFLIILSIFDFILLIKQITFFKQFKVVRESSIEQKIEKKVKNKTSIIVFAIILDIVAFIVGIIGIMVNARTFPSGNISWPLSLIDGLVSIFSLISIVLLIVKLKSRNKSLINTEPANKDKLAFATINVSDNNNQSLDIDQVEYQLLKLKQLKVSKIISNDEFESMRKNIIGVNTIDDTPENTNNND